jgi:tetratricopeptide (TPR) repeat protein
MAVDDHGGRLGIPRSNYRRFKRQMKRLRGNWVSEARLADRSLSIYQWAAVADHLIDRLIDEGTGAMNAVRDLPSGHQQRAINLLREAIEIIDANGGRSFVVDDEIGSTDTTDRGPIELSTEEKQAMDLIGEAITQANDAYQAAKAKDSSIQTSIDLISTSPDAGALRVHLDLAKAMDALYPIGPFRIAWIRATHNALIRLSAHQYDSLDEAKAAVNLLVREYGKHELGLSKSPIIWALNADRDHVIEMFNDLMAQLGVLESAPEEAYATMRRIHELEELRRDGVISDDTFIERKAEALSEWERDHG